jgi:hypothetical protein
MEPPMQKTVNLARYARRFALMAVEFIVRFKRATEKLLLPHEGRVKPEGSIALEALIARFPRYLSVPPGEVQCGEGWYPLIWDLCTAVEALEHLGMPKISSLRAKERLGGLFIRVESNSFLVRELAREAEHRAATVCEECGAEGSLRLGHGFAKTLCPEHAKLRKRPRHQRAELSGGNGLTPKLVFVDAEFTDFDYPQLISIGLVADSGESFYVELANGWSRTGCSHFVKQNILPQLTGGDFFQERSFAGRRLADWLGDFDCQVRVVSDAPGYDWVLMMDLLGKDAPGNLFPEPMPLYSDCFPELVPILQEARAKAFHGSSPHHALNDAEALRETWEIMKINVHPAVLDQYLRNY